MELKKLTKLEKTKVLKLLMDYWKERGMPDYDKKWTQKYLDEGHRKEIKNDEFFVYKNNNKLVGMVSLITDISNIAEIRDFVVKPKYRNKGYGRMILNELIILAKDRKIRKLYALTFPKYKKFLKSFGFEEEGFLKSHFIKGEDLTIMSKFLK